MLLTLALVSFFTGVGDYLVQRIGEGAAGLGDQFLFALSGWGAVFQNDVIRIAHRRGPWFIGLWLYFGHMGTLRVLDLFASRAGRWRNATRDDEGVSWSPRLPGVAVLLLVGVIGIGFVGLLRRRPYESDLGQW